MEMLKKILFIAILAVSFCTSATAASHNRHGYNNHGQYQQRHGGSSYKAKHYRGPSHNNYNRYYNSRYNSRYNNSYSHRYNNRYNNYGYRNGYKASSRPNYNHYNSGYRSNSYRSNHDRPAHLR